MLMQFKVNQQRQNRKKNGHETYEVNSKMTGAKLKFG